jgi:uncharacterized phiE125 gp8 family phage protein
VGLSLVTGPTAEPITLEDTKAFAHITTADDDALIASLITTARQFIEGPNSWVERSLMPQTWNYTLAAFPAGAIELPLPPLASVTEIRYLDAAGVSQVMAPAGYVANTTIEPGTVAPITGGSWPATQAGPPNAVTVKYVAGYTSESAVPAEIKTWLKQCVGFLYLNREAPTLPPLFVWSLGRYKKRWVF